MAHSEHTCTLDFSAGDNEIHCQGMWTIAHIVHVKNQLNKLKWPQKSQVIIDGSQIIHMDTAGAWLLNKILFILQNYHNKISLRNFKEEQQTLIKLVLSQPNIVQTTSSQPKPNIFYRVGKYTIALAQQGFDFFAFFGELWVVLFRLLHNIHKIRWRAIFSTIVSSGFQALPIIALLSFLIGIVLAYQMGQQLRNYGANIYIVDLLGLSVLREFAPLMTSIIIAGRTGSAFAAQLGTMKVNQEIDALRTIGISPAELLILPKILGMIIVLPLLTVWSDIFGIIGGMLMSKNILDINFLAFLKRFNEAISVKHFIIGISKAPVFAMIIASIGLFQGLQVSGSAESVGQQTTKSVVQAIFFIIIADAIFSIIFSWLKI